MKIPKSIPVLKPVLASACLAVFLTGCATTSQNSSAPKAQPSGVTKTGADSRLESLSREELAREIPAPTPVEVPALPPAPTSPPVPKS